MDDNFVGNVIGAGIALAIIDRVGSKPRKRKHHKLKRVSEY